MNRWMLPPGPLNAITDVPGVSVGHHQLLGGGIATGVTAILPHGGDLFRRPVPAGVEVFNGFGKSAGLMQLAELGEIETPVVLTGTFGVPACMTGLIRRAIRQNPQIGREWSTVNALVLECNDGAVNDIQAMALPPGAVDAAIAAAGPQVAQGTEGAGTGMKTFGFAGGIGTASRLIDVEGEAVTLGALVLSNFGSARHLRIGATVPPAGADDPDRGSIIMVLATDAPLDSRQLRRVAGRGAAALGRVGSHIGHGSGDVALAFSTAEPLDRDGPLRQPATRWRESALDPLFLAAVESIEEAIWNAMWFAVPREGWRGDRLPAFRERFPHLAPR